jgi:outer membrane autotransporter protein
MTLVHGFGDVHTSRFDVGGTSSASYFATLWGAMAELSYYHALPDNWRFVPKLTFDWVRARTDSFVETGGTTPIAGNGVTSSRIRLLVGGEIGHSWLFDRTIMDFAMYGRLVDNLSQEIGTLTVSDPSGVATARSILGIRESNLGGDAGATLSAKLSELARLYAAYDGRFRSNFTSHTGTVGAELRF